MGADPYSLPYLGSASGGWALSVIFVKILNLIRIGCSVKNGIVSSHKEKTISKVLEVCVSSSESL